MKNTKCLHCGTPKPSDAEFNEGIENMGFTLDLPTAIYDWVCFDCNCEWSENSIGEIIKITKKGD